MVSMRQVFHTDESAKVPLGSLVSLVCAGFQIMGHRLQCLQLTAHLFLASYIQVGFAENLVEQKTIERSILLTNLFKVGEYIRTHTHMKMHTRMRTLAKRKRF